MKKSIGMLQEFISLQKRIEKKYGDIRLDEMQEHFYIRICEKPDEVIHKSPDASFKQTVTYLYKQMIDCKPDNTRFVNGYAHLIGEPRDFAKDFLNMVHDYRTLEQHELSDKDYQKYARACKEWMLGAISKEAPSENKEWRTCEHYLLEQGSEYLGKILSIFEKFPGGEELLQNEWFSYQKQNITLIQARDVLEKIKSDYGYEFDTKIYYRQHRDKLKQSLQYMDWKSNEVDRQVYESFRQVVFQNPPRRKVLVQQEEIKEKYKIKDKRQLGKIMQEVSALCQEKPECSREDIWRLVSDILSGPNALL